LDIQQFISSGIIESYLLGLTSQQENSQVKEFALQYPEVDKAIRDFRAALERYALMHEVAPPPDLKGKVWEAIQQDIPTREETAAEESKIITLTDPVGQQKKGTWVWKFAAAASILLLICSVILNYLTARKYQDALNSYQQLVFSRNDLLMERQVYQSSVARLEKEMQIFHDPSVKPVTMMGVKTHPGMMATVYWNTRSGELYLAVNNLPAPPSQMEYQLWAIVDGKPVSAGVFNRNAALTSLQKLQVAGIAQAFAITLEKEGGSPVPTLSNMYVMGKV